jgi:hypothetical protein
MNSSVMLAVRYYDIVDCSNVNKPFEFLSTTRSMSQCIVMKYFALLVPFYLFTKSIKVEANIQNRNKLRLYECKDDFIGKKMSEYKDFLSDLPLEVCSRRKSITSPPTDNPAHSRLC